MNWTMFDRCHAGFVKSEIDNKKIRFLTLTTSPCTGACLSNSDRLELIQRSFRVLKRRYEIDFAKRDGDGKILEFADFGDYFSCRTLEGYGVVHVVYRGKFIPRDWIVANWNEIHGSQIVDIRFPRGDPWDGSMYVVSQYMSDQGVNPVFGYSYNWVYRGFPYHYKQLIDISRVGVPKSFSFVSGEGGLCSFWYVPVDWSLYRKRLRDWLVRKNFLDSRKDWRFTRLDDFVV